MIDYQRLFHTGLLVSDLETSMAVLGRSLGLSWAEPYRFENLPFWTPETGTREIELLVTYSRQGPQHLELIQGAADGFYAPSGDPGTHHVGVWVDDVAAEVALLEQQGWTPVAAGGGPGQGYGTFAYLSHPDGKLLLELVSSELLPAFENWWAGGSFG